MPNPFLGQIIMFAGNFPIQGFAECDGQLLLIGQNNALFNLLGTIYGGDGRTTFGLPDLRGRLPIHQGTGPGLSVRNLGQRIGSEDANVQANQMPIHDHVFNADALPALNLAIDNALVAEASNTNIYGQGTPPDTLDASAIDDSGGGSSHDNVMPYLCVNFLIALSGTFPPQT
jgi:microcystin-dependent protein